MSCCFIHFYSAQCILQIFNCLDSVSRCCINVKRKKRMRESEAWMKAIKEENPFQWLQSSPNHFKLLQFGITFCSFMAPFSLQFVRLQENILLYRNTRRNSMLENVTNTKAFRLNCVAMCNITGIKIYIVEICMLYICSLRILRYATLQQNIENYNYINNMNNRWMERMKRELKLPIPKFIWCEWDLVCRLSLFRHI